MYVLGPDEAVEERLAHPLNFGISRNRMDLLERNIETQTTMPKLHENARSGGLFKSTSCHCIKVTNDEMNVIVNMGCIQFSKGYLLSKTYYLDFLQ